MSNFKGTILKYWDNLLELANRIRMSLANDFSKLAAKRASQKESLYTKPMPYWKDSLRRRRRARRIRNMSPGKLITSRRVVTLTKMGFLSVIAGFIILLVLIPYMAFNLPSPDKIVRREGFSTKITDRNGKVLYDIYSDQNRIPITIDSIPQYLKDATISIEDKNFYNHQGFDPLGILRGLSKIVTKGRAEGGSTLTQQLVKNVLVGDERSITRKIKEFILAIQIERKYSKDEILQMYFNEAPYGGTAWGVGAAAQTYFGKDVKDLDLVESVILAGLPQRPSYYSPYSSNPDAYIDRAKQVLRRMREDGHITKEQGQVWCGFSRTGWVAGNNNSRPGFAGRSTKDSFRRN
ncbi:MAG: hypothetical protein UT61_C0017G0010 [Candidatus Woesebacteria bacterium GW2011_GWA1_39_8]|uniref:Glycosyl transferase family 51 domain-containing protein n=1 Tax=Candidatus Woesebacteria bacterium GW2011_GWA1_39_8 TaxID=1618552 RepID=A0A0G0PPY9_9BACT|nr:MAG: hypothetical protein UT61_C0017G0010 [Candidatus Woesebacteria bacterium GW2011_GWA1_39_8]